MADSTAIKPQAYDVVGRYRQDEINGFSETLITRLIEIVDPATAGAVLDAMAGDGNLTERLLRFCRDRGIPNPELTALEISRVQAEFARKELSRVPAKVLCGDAVTMTTDDAGGTLPDCSFDRVVIKSGNHEIHRDRQLQLYKSLFRVLRPGGSFINLGFLFDDEQERNELREIARVKDSIAGMDAAVANRHFLTRAEFYALLKEAGFVDVRSAESLEYRIRSTVVRDQYFAKTDAGKANAEFQAAQARALTMRTRGRIRFEGDSTLMVCPGEITIARRPTWAESNHQAFRHCPYDFLRHLECHRELLAKAVKSIPERSTVLDLGCGPGLLAERLISKVRRYRGIEITPEFTQKCVERYGNAPGFSFTQGDIGKEDLGTSVVDVISLLNVIYLPGIDPIQVLRKIFTALKPGGRLIISGPTSQESYRQAEPKMRAQLEKDGLLDEYGPFFKAVGEANARLLPGQGNYWAAEGMATLLKELGFREILSVDTTLYYGFAYLVVAEK